MVIKVSNLWQQLASFSTLQLAWDKVHKKHGAAGVDGITIEMFEQNSKVLLKEIQRELQTGSYSPSPVRKALIHSLEGKEREIAIPTIKDRIVQQALLRVLQPIFELNFLDCSFAYRPNKGALRAAMLTQQYIRKGFLWVLRMDIKDFFNNIDHDLLLSMLKEKIREDAILSFITSMLKSQVFDNMSLRECEVGAAQGSGLSPLLANIYLTTFDEFMTKQGYKMIRYADDIAVFGKDKDTVQRAQEEGSSFLQDLKLELNLEKTKIAHVKDGFIFLGYCFDPSGQRASSKALEALRLRLEASLREKKDLPLQQQLDALKQVLKGWRNYYGTLTVLEAQDLTTLAAMLSLALESNDKPLYAELAKRRMDLAQVPQEPDLHLLLADLWQGADMLALSIWELAIVLSEQENNENAERALWNLLYEGQQNPPRFESEEYKSIKTEITSAFSEPYFVVASSLMQSSLESISFTLAEIGLYQIAKKIQEFAQQLEVGISSPELALPESSQLIASSKVSLEMKNEDLYKMLELFSGREGVFAVESVDYFGVRSFQKIMRQIQTSDLREHLDGKKTLGVYLLRLNNTVKFAVLDIDVNRKLLLQYQSEQARISELLSLAHKDATRILSTASKFGLPCYIENSGYKGRHCWFFFEQAIKGENAKQLLEGLIKEAGEPSPGIGWEVFPQQTKIKANAVGQLIKLPLGIHSKTKTRGLFIDEAGIPYEDQVKFLSQIQTISLEQVQKVLMATQPEKKPSETGIKTVLTKPIFIDYLSLFSEMPKAAKVISGCNLLRYLVGKAKETNWLEHHERLLLLRTLGHLGEEGKMAIHKVMSLTLNYNREVTERFLRKLEKYPISCAKIRANYAELTASLGCDCSFRVPPRGYPSPILHALKASEVSGMKEKRKAEKVAINSKREAREQAEALVKRLVELRKNFRGVVANIEKCENELGELFNNNGIERMELSLGVLKRKKEGEKVVWVIEV